MEKLHLTVGFITLISMAVCIVSLIITIAIDSMIWFELTKITLLITFLGTVIFNLWKSQLKKH